MSRVLFIAAGLYVLFAIYNIWRRPGHFAAVFLLSYGLATFFGSIGPITGAISILAGLAATNAQKEQHKLLGAELSGLIWILMSCLSFFTTPQMDITIVYVASLVLLATSSYLYARAFAGHPHFFEDLAIGGGVISFLCMTELVKTAAGAALGAAASASHVGLAVMPELCLAAVISFLLFHRGHGWKTTIVIVLLTCGLLLPLTVGLGTRSVFLSIGVAFLVLLLFRILEGGAARILTVLAGGMVVLAASAAILWQHVASTPLGKLILIGGSRLLMGPITGDISGDPSSLERLNLYKEAWKLFYRAPIFGSGAGSFGYLADNAGGAYPHNMFLEIMVQSGLIGVLLVLGAVIPLAIVGFRGMLKRPVSWGLAFALAMFTSAIVRHQVSMSVTQGKLLFFSLGCFAARQLMERKRDTVEHAVLPEAAEPSPDAAPP